MPSAASATDGLPPPAAEVTGPVAYVRFHGRNAGAWWGKGPAPKPGDPIGHDRADGREAGERYRYLYKEEELKDWVPRVREMAGKAGVLYAFFNNHPEGFAVRNAKEFRNLVGARGENAQD